MDDQRTARALEATITMVKLNDATPKNNRKIDWPCGLSPEAVRKPLCQYSKTRYRQATDRASEPVTGRSHTGQPITLDLPHGAKLYTTGLELPNDLTAKAWAEIGLKLTKVEDSMQWALGDWWAYGDFKYGERKALTTDLGFYCFGSLMNMATVARRVPTSLRNEVLSWSHHCTVALCSLKDQKMWLDKAAKNKWTVRELRKQIREFEGKYRPWVTAETWYDRIRQWIERASNDAYWASGWNHWVSVETSHPELDYCSEAYVDQLVEATREAANAWTQIADNFEQYRQHRQAQGQSFKPRPLKKESPAPSAEGRGSNGLSNSVRTNGSGKASRAEHNGHRRPNQTQ